MENFYRKDCNDIVELYFLLCIQNKNSTPKVKYNCMKIANNKIEECINKNKKIKSS